jgi:penicillin-binding protein 1A
MFGDADVDANSMQSYVDENGMPLQAPPSEPGYPQEQPMVRPDGTGEPSQQELDQAFPPQAPQQQPRPPEPRMVRPPEPRSTPPPDPSQPRAEATQ